MIKTIEIRNLGQHEYTSFNVGSELTLIAAANGTGKSTFSNVLDSKMNEYLNAEFLNPSNSEIIFRGRSNLKNSWIFDEQEQKFKQKNIKSKLKLVFDVFNDQEFFKLLSNHNTKNSLISLNRQYNNKMRTLKEYDIVKFLKLAYDKIMNFEKPTFDNFDKHYGTKSVQITSEEKFAKLIEQWELEAANVYPKINFNSERIVLNKSVVSATAIKFSKLAKNKTLQFRQLFEEFYGSSFNFFFDFKNINILDNNPTIEEYKVLHIWLELINSLKKTWKSSPQLSSATFDMSIDYNYSSQLYMSYDKTVIKYYKEKYETARDEFKAQKQKNKMYSKMIENAIKSSPLFNKIKIKTDLTVISRKENRRVILSTGELKILNLILFLTEKISSKGVIVLDDPLASVDAEYVDFFSKFIRDYINEHKKQIIFLTHSNHVFYSMISSFNTKIQKEFSNRKKSQKSSNSSKQKSAIKSVAIHRWTLDNKFVVSTKEITKYQTHIFVLAEKILDEKNDYDDRIQYFRRLIENLCFAIYGNSEFKDLFRTDEKDPSKVNFYFLGNKYQFNWDAQKLLNAASHGNYIDVEESLNLEVRKIDFIKSIVHFVKQIGIIDSKISNGRPFKVLD